MFTLIAIAAALSASDATNSANDDAVFSTCVLSEIANLEHTTPDKLNTFTKSEANKAFAKCEAVKIDWAKSLDTQLSSDPHFSDPILRKAEINRIISTDELSAMLLVRLKAK